MVDIYITKQAAAQRQIDAAIRILFSGEDELAVHTLVAAGHRLVSDLDKKSGDASQGPYSNALQDLQERFPGALVQFDDSSFRRWLERHQRYGANFLKHADNDPGKSLNPADLQTDDLLLISCFIYMKLGLDLTQEMRAFGRWHSAVHPNEPQDEIQTSVGNVSGFSRPDQLDFGNYLLERLSESS